MEQPNSSSNSLDLEEPTVEPTHQYDIAAIVAILDRHDLSFEEYKGKIKLADGAYAFLCLVLKVIDNINHTEQKSESTLKDINLAVITDIINYDKQSAEKFYPLLALLSDEIIVRYFYDNFNQPWDSETDKQVYLRELTTELRGIFAYERMRYSDELDKYFKRIGLEVFIQKIESLVEQSGIESFTEEKNKASPSEALLELIEAMSQLLLDFLARVIGSRELLPAFIINNSRRIFNHIKDSMYVGTYLLLYHINPRIVDAAMLSTVGFTKQLIIETISKPLQIIASERVKDLKVNETEQRIYEKIYHPVDGVLILMDESFKKFLNTIIQPQDKGLVPRQKARDSSDISVQQRFRVVLAKEFYGKGLKWNSVLIEIVAAMDLSDESSPESPRKLRRGNTAFFKKDSAEADAARELNRTFSDPEIKGVPPNSTATLPPHRFNLVAKFRQRRHTAGSPPRARKQNHRSHAPSPKPGK